MLDVHAEEAEIVAKGTCGSNVNWYCTSDKVMHVSGSGEIENNWIVTERSYIEEWDLVQTVIIEEGITRIAEDAFSCYGGATFPFYGKDERLSASITEVQIPSTVTEIGARAFLYNVKLKKVEFTSNSKLKIIGESAFFDCWSLEEISVPDTVTSIGAYVFLRCSSLKEIKIPPSVKALRWSVFEECYSLKSVACSVVEIEQSVFTKCTSLESIIIPSGVESIGRGAFTDCSNLKEVHLPDSLKKIDSNAFEGCSSLKDITLPDGLETISVCAFSDCISLEEIFIPENVNELGCGIFKGCTSLKTVYFYGNLPEVYFKFRPVTCIVTTDEEKGYGYVGEQIYYFPDIFDTGIRVVVNPDLSITIGGTTIPNRIQERTEEVAKAFDGYYEYDGQKLFIRDNGYARSEWKYGWDYGWTIMDAQRLYLPMAPRPVQSQSSGLSSSISGSFKSNIQTGSSLSSIRTNRAPSQITAYYPLGKKNWTDANRKSLSKLATWKSFNPYGYKETTTVKVSKIKISAISKK